MALTADQRKELQEFGATNVRFKLPTHGAGRGAAISGFKCGDITRGDIEDWLAEKSREETALQQRILFWARVAGWTGIVGIVIAAADWLFKK
jgi:hypothetical protein